MHISLVGVFFSLKQIFQKISSQLGLPVYTAMCMAASSKVTQSPASTLSLAASTWCVVVDSRWYILRLFKKYLLGKVYPIVIYFLKNIILKPA